MWGFFIAILSGALMSVQGVFNSGVTKQTSVWTAAGFVQLTGFLTCVLIWLCKDRGHVSDLFHVSDKYMLSGGVIGAIITYTVIRSVGDMGPAKAILLIVVSQIIVAYLIEMFGMFGVEKAAFEWKKLLGALIAIAGIVTFHWGS